MESKQSLLHLFLFFLLLGIASSTSKISSGVFDPNRTSSKRSLMPLESSCSVDFEHFDYSKMTKKCKGPHYSTDTCCPELKDLMCPFSDQVNDLESGCADVFFSYVNLYGRYPVGLFASLCQEAGGGLDCSDY